MNQCTPYLVKTFYYCHRKERNYQPISWVCISVWLKEKYILVKNIQETTNTCEEYKSKFLFTSKSVSSVSFIIGIIF